jgi:hypothetical protein
LHMKASDSCKNQGIVNQKAKLKQIFVTVQGFRVQG